jgi:hypothetical protein
MTRWSTSIALESLEPGSQTRPELTIVYLGSDRWSISVSNLSRTEAAIAAAALLKGRFTGVVDLVWKREGE